MTEFYDIYLMHCGMVADSTVASKKTFNKVYTEKWKTCLRIRGIAQHAKCSTCQRLKQELTKCDSVAQKNAIAVEYKKHLDEQFADRAVDSRLNLLSEQSCRKGCELPS
eukprot:6808825-Pyramimonas_sp.AAC.1